FQLRQRVRPPRRLRPVLALLVERVRRRARADAESNNVLERPRVGAVRVREILRPMMPVATVHLRERAPGGEVVERASFAFPERGVRDFTTGRPRYSMEPLEGGAFGGPRGVAVDGVDAL